MNEDEDLGCSYGEDAIDFISEGIRKEIDREIIKIIRVTSIKHNPPDDPDDEFTELINTNE